MDIIKIILKLNCLFIFEFIKIIFILICKRIITKFKKKVANYHNYFGYVVVGTSA